MTLEPNSQQVDTLPPDGVPVVSEEQARTDLLNAAVKED